MSGTMARADTVRFGVIGLNHDHIYDQTAMLLAAGAELVSVYAPEPELVARFVERFPQAQPARSMAEVLEAPTIHLVVSASIPDERGLLGVAAMQHGKDYLSDKPGFTTLAQVAEARRVQAETGRIHAVYFSERFGNAATVKAGELVQAGAIGRPLQTIGLGPHRLANYRRPAWFFERDRFGGILNDIASHQMDQFLFFTGSTSAAIVAAQVGNLAHPAYPNFEDFGDVTLRGNNGLGYIRVDWFTPAGLPTWGDTRLTILGTEGYIEIRKNCDIAGRPGANHLFLVNNQGTQYIESDDVALPYGTQFLDDIRNRTETAMSQAHCFLASELALQAQAHAHRLDALSR